MTNMWWTVLLWSTCRFTLVLCASTPPSPVRTYLMEGSGSLEDQLEGVKARASEIATKKETLRKIEELGAHIEEALIFDNR